MSEIPLPPSENEPSPVSGMPLPESILPTTEQEEQAISDAMDEAVRAAIAAEVDVDVAVANSVAYDYTTHDAIPQDPSTAEVTNLATGAEAPMYDYTPHVALPQDPQAAEEDTSRPLGKVCPPGQELTGRWTREEQERFVEGLERYGKDWKKVAAVVETR